MDKLYNKELNLLDRSFKELLPIYTKIFSFPLRVIKLDEKSDYFEKELKMFKKAFKSCSANDYPVLKNLLYLSCRIGLNPIFYADDEYSFLTQHLDDEFSQYERWGKNIIRTNKSVALYNDFYNNKSKYYSKTTSAIDKIHLNNKYQTFNDDLQFFKTVFNTNDIDKINTLWNCISHSRNDYKFIIKHRELFTESEYKFLISSFNCYPLDYNYTKYWLKNENYTPSDKEFSSKNINFIPLSKCKGKKIQKFLNEFISDNLNSFTRSMKYFEYHFFHSYILFDKKCKNILGIIATKMPEDADYFHFMSNSVSEIKLYISNKYRRKGYGKEALNTFIDKLFSGFFYHIYESNRQFVYKVRNELPSIIVCKANSILEDYKQNGQNFLSSCNFIKADNEEIAKLNKYFTVNKNFSGLPDCYFYITKERYIKKDAKPHKFITSDSDYIKFFDDCPYRKRMFGFIVKYFGSEVAYSLGRDNVLNLVIDSKKDNYQRLLLGFKNAFNSKKKDDYDLLWNVLAGPNKLKILSKDLSYEEKEFLDYRSKTMLANGYKLKTNKYSLYDDLPFFTDELDELMSKTNYDKDIHTKRLILRPIKNRVFEFKILLKANKKEIGDISFYLYSILYYENDRNFPFYIIINKEYRRKGYATEAFNELLKYAKNGQFKTFYATERLYDYIYKECDIKMLICDTTKDYDIGNKFIRSLGFKQNSKIKRSNNYYMNL